MIKKAEEEEEEERETEGNIQTSKNYRTSRITIYRANFNV